MNITVTSQFVFVNLSLVRQSLPDTPTLIWYYSPSLVPLPLSGSSTPTPPRYFIPLIPLTLTGTPTPLVKDNEYMRQ